MFYMVVDLVLVMKKMMELYEGLVFDGEVEGEFWGGWLNMWFGMVDLVIGLFLVECVIIFESLNLGDGMDGKFGFN